MRGGMEEGRSCCELEGGRLHKRCRREIMQALQEGRRTGGAGGRMRLCSRRWHEEERGFEALHTQETRIRPTIERKK